MRSHIKHKILVIASAVITATMIVACNKSKSSGGGPAPAPVPVPVSCPPGQIMTNAGCTIQGVVPVNMGPIQYYSSMNDRFNSSGNSFQPDSSYTDFLQNALGVCERCVNSYGEALQCSTWENGFNMIRLEFVQGVSNRMRVHFYSTPILQNNYFTYAWNFPSLEDFFLTWFTGAPPPSCNPGQYAPYWYGDFNVETTNGSQGFVLYGQGPYLSKWNRHTIRIYVDTGKIGDPNFNYRVVAYTPTNEVIHLVNGSFSRCQSQNCGLY
jgi:hypothetical protein